MVALGRFDEAVRTFSRAISLAEERGDVRQAQQLQQQLELYRAGRPYLESAPPMSP
jgi:hypothetical protein